VPPANAPLVVALPRFVEPPVMMIGSIGPAGPAGDAGPRVYDKAVMPRLLITRCRSDTGQPVRPAMTSSRDPVCTHRSTLRVSATALDA
jgi:hypothetical protein